MAFDGGVWRQNFQKLANCHRQSLNIYYLYFLYFHSITSLMFEIFLFDEGTGLFVGEVETLLWLKLLMGV